MVNDIHISTSRLLKMLNLQQIGRNYYNPNDPISIPNHRFGKRILELRGVQGKRMRIWYCSGGLFCNKTMDLNWYSWEACDLLLSFLYV